jgi:hypothetical protein
MELKLEYDDSNEYHVNFEQVASSAHLPATIRLLAFDLIKAPYLSLGDFFKNASDRSIQELIEMVNDTENDEDAMENLILLTMMLMTAEGLVITDDNDLHEATNAMTMIICGVSLARKGLVRMFYENLSFGEDMKHKTIMEKL